MRCRASYRRGRALWIAGTALLLFLVAGALFFFNGTEIGRLLTVRQRGFTQISADVYLQSELENPEISSEILRRCQEARRNVENFWGDTLRGKPVFIFAEDRERLYPLGFQQQDRAVTVTYVYNGAHSYVLAPLSLINQNTLTHEWMHAELHARVYQGAWSMCFQDFPYWFDEGIASQNHDEVDGEDGVWEELTGGGTDVIFLDSISSADAFYDEDPAIQRRNYVISKHEVREWLKKYGMENLMKVIEGINQGGSFHSLYFYPEDNAGSTLMLKSS